jgi:alcohol dehydrogenase class IV
MSSLLGRHADFGAASVERLPDIVRRIGPTRVFLVTDAVLRRAGLVDRVRGLLDADGLETATYDAVEPNPTTRSLDRAGDDARSFGQSTVVALGGGSVLDTAKGVALLGANQGSVGDLATATTRPGWPLVAIPTTAGSGAETNGFGVIEDASAHRKVYVGHDSVRPRHVVLDPELTVGLPRAATAATGMDALVHGIESLASLGATPESTEYAVRAIALVSGSLRRAVADGADLEARSQMLLAAHLAGLALTRSGLGLVHGIAHALTNHTGAVHGLALAAVLDEVMARTADAAGDAYHAAGRAMAVDGGVEAVVAAVRTLADDVGASVSLRTLGVDESMLPSIAAGALADAVSVNHPRVFGVDEVEALLAARL